MSAEDVRKPPLPDQPLPDQSRPEQSRPEQSRADQTLARQVGNKAARKLRARRRGPTGVWFGLGMMGLIGWSVAVPTVIGAAIGVWLDKHYPGQHGWTLALLMAGLTLGCFSAWRWIAKEERAMHEEERDDDAA